MSTTTDKTDEQELGAAGAQLSTAPEEEAAGAIVPGSFGGLRKPGFGGAAAWTVREGWGWLRWMWRQLTSMRVALILLFLVSLAAIPGSLVPQTSINPVKVQDFVAAHPTAAPIYEKLGLFHVYSSVWFSAVYILLFVSLAGCIIPRSWQFVGQLRSKPPAAPRNLTRLPAYATWRTAAEPDEVLASAQSALRRRRFRTTRAGTAVASEKGFLREAGNLLFHIALFGLLISFAVGQLWKGDGSKLIVEGDGFANTITAYDNFTAGAFYGPDDLNAFGFDLNSFTATYATSGPDKGSARTFRANIHYWTGAEGKKHKGSIEVNKPLEIAGSKIYLNGHGYAPVVSVKDGSGTVVYSGAVAFLPTDTNLTSTGVIKVPDAVDKNGKADQLGFSGLFTPSFKLDSTLGPISVFPALANPWLILTAYHGDLGVDSGLPQNVYQLDTKNLKQFKDSKGNIVSKAMQVGDTMTLPNGAGSITFEGIKTFAQFEVTHQPATGWALTSALSMIIGLAGSLFIQRRRVWVRAVRGGDGVTVVELAGLGRSESARIADELGTFVDILLVTAPVQAEQPSEEATSEEATSEEPTSKEPASEEVPSEASAETQPEDEGARA